MSRNRLGALSYIESEHEKAAAFLAVWEGDLLTLGRSLPPTAVAARIPGTDFPQFGMRQFSSRRHDVRTMDYDHGRRGTEPS